MSHLIAALSAGLGFTFCVAGMVKVGRPVGAERMLVPLLPAATWRWTSSRTVARAAAAVEFVVGGLLLTSSGLALTATAIAATAVGLVLSLIAVQAAAKRVPCGCMGRRRGAAGTAEILRAALITVAAVALASLTLGAPAVAFDQRTSGGALIAVAIALGLLALPNAIAIARAVQRDLVSFSSHARSHRGPSAESQRDRGISRKAFLAHAVAAVAALIGVGGLPGAAQANPPRTCQDLYNLCYGCDPNQNHCCIECYVLCQLGGACAPGSCGGCWPGR